jgi:hypothetical protein
MLNSSNGGRRGMSNNNTGSHNVDLLDV